MPLWDFYGTENNKRLRLNEACHTNVNEIHHNNLNKNNSYSSKINQSLDESNNTTNDMETKTTVSNTKHLLHRIKNLFQNPDLSDIKLIFTSNDGCLKSEFKLHKLILCSGSEVFRAMLNPDVWRESTTAEVTLTEESFLHSSLHSFLSYFYSGEISLQHSSILNILILADKYQVIDLQEVCVDFMLRHITTATAATNLACSWLQYSHLTNHQKLTHLSASFIQHNFNKVVEGGDFLNLDDDWLLHFLSCSSLVVTDEVTLLQATVRWFLGRPSKTTFTQEPSGYKQVTDQVPIHQASLKSDSFTTTTTKNPTSSSTTPTTTSTTSPLIPFNSSQNVILSNENLNISNQNCEFSIKKDEIKSNKNLNPFLPHHISPLPHISPSSSPLLISSPSQISPPSPKISPLTSPPPHFSPSPLTSSYSSSLSTYSLNHSPSDINITDVTDKKLNTNSNVEGHLEPELNKNDGNFVKNCGYDGENGEDYGGKDNEDEVINDDNKDDEENDDDDDGQIMEDLLSKIRFPLMTVTQQRAIQTEVRQYLPHSTPTHSPISTPSFTNTTTKPPLPSKTILSHFKSFTPINYISSKITNHKRPSANEKTSPPPPTLKHPNFTIFTQNHHKPGEVLEARFKRLLKAILCKIEATLNLLHTIKNPANYMDIQGLLTSHGFDNDCMILRNYTNDVWCTDLSIDKFQELAKFEMRSVLFSSPSHPLFPEESPLYPWCDWSVELSPKGVFFQKCLLIGLWRNLEVMGDSHQTVRLSIHSNKNSEKQKSISPPSPFIHPTTPPFVNRYTPPFINPSSHPFVNPSTYPFVHPSTHLSFHSSTHPSFHPSESRRVIVTVLITAFQNNVEFILKSVERRFTFDSNLETKIINDLVPFACLNCFNNNKSNKSNNNHFSNGVYYDCLDAHNGFTLVNSNNDNDVNISSSGSSSGSGSGSNHDHNYFCPSHNNNTNANNIVNNNNTNVNNTTNNNTANNNTAKNNNDNNNNDNKYNYNGDNKVNDFFCCSSLLGEKDTFKVSIIIKPLVSL